MPVRKHCYRAGIDISSTTAKLVILDERGVCAVAITAATVRTRRNLAEAAGGRLRSAPATCLKITGSSAINLGKALNIGFVREVVAVASSCDHCPQTDVAIELGGEDAKIICFRSGLEERMNSVCAGGTARSSTQMAALLQTDAERLNRAWQTITSSVHRRALQHVHKSDISRSSTKAQRCPIWRPSFFRPSSARPSPALPAARNASQLRRLPRRPAALPARLKGLHPHAAPDA